jgi:phage replication O-like protein O
MSNVVPLRNTGGFTRMDNDLYEALIGADLSGRELRVALAIHRFTSGYNVECARIPAATIGKLSGIARENVSRIIGELIRQRVIYRAGGSKAPIGLAPSNEWQIDAKNDDKKTPSKTTQSVKSDTSLVSNLTHIKDRNTKTTANAVVAAVASTDDEGSAFAANQEPTTEPVQPEPKAERIPYQRIIDLYNATCGEKLPRCLKLDPKRKRQIANCWNLEINGCRPFRKSEFWEAYFSDCLQNKHWIGENDRGWTADIEFITRIPNVLKVLEAL